jgi:hypothetical protein
MIEKQVNHIKESNVSGTWCKTHTASGDSWNGTRKRISLCRQFFVMIHLAQKWPVSLFSATQMLNFGPDGTKEKKTYHQSVAEMFKESGLELFKSGIIWSFIWFIPQNRSCWWEGLQNLRQPWPSKGLYYDQDQQQLLRMRGQERWSAKGRQGPGSHVGKRSKFKVHNSFLTHFFWGIR